MVNIKSPSIPKKSRKDRKNSKILKKYEIGYENCIKKAMKSNKNKIRKECLKKSKKNIKKSVDKKRSPTKYQKFMKKHSNDIGIAGLSPASRMRKIAKLWKKRNINKN